MISGDTLIRTLQRNATPRNHPTGGKLFPPPMYDQAEHFDARAQRGDQDLHSVYRDTIARDFSTDAGKRAALLTLSASTNALRALEKDPEEFAEVDRHHAEAARRFAELPFDVAERIARAATRQTEARDRLFAFRQFLPEKHHVDGDHLRALAPMLPHLPEAARSDETRELFSRVAHLPRDEHARTVKAVAGDVLENTKDSDDAERAHRPIVAHLVKSLERIDDGDHAFAAMEAVHAIAAKADDGLIRDGHAPLLEPRAITLMRRADLDDDHRRKVRQVVAAVDRRLLAAWALNLKGSRRTRPATLAEILGEVPRAAFKPPVLPPEPPTIERQFAAFARESMLPTQLLREWEKHVPAARKPRRTVD